MSDARIREGVEIEVGVGIGSKWWCLGWSCWRFEEKCQASAKSGLAAKLNLVLTPIFLLRHKEQLILHLIFRLQRHEAASIGLEKYADIHSHPGRDLKSPARAAAATAWHPKDVALIPTSSSPQLHDIPIQPPEIITYISKSTSRASTTTRSVRQCSACHLKPDTRRYREAMGANAPSGAGRVMDAIERSDEG